MGGRKHIDNYFTPGGIVGHLVSGGRLQTHVEDEEGLPLYLEQGDEECSACGELIDRDSFGSAPYGRVLGRMKQATGATYCGECFLSVDDADGTASERRADANEEVEVVEKQD